MNYIEININDNNSNGEGIKMKKGDKVKTIYGRTETVMIADNIHIVTYESASRGSWYHPTKVFKTSK